MLCSTLHGAGRAGGLSTLCELVSMQLLSGLIMSDVAAFLSENSDRPLASLYRASRHGHSIKASNTQ